MRGFNGGGVRAPMRGFNNVRPNTFVNRQFVNNSNMSRGYGGYRGLGYGGYGGYRGLGYGGYGGLGYGGLGYGGMGYGGFGGYGYPYGYGMNGYSGYPYGMYGYYPYSVPQTYLSFPAIGNAIDLW